MNTSVPAGFVIPVRMGGKQPEVLRSLPSWGRVGQFPTKTPAHTTLLPAMLGGFIAVAVDQALLGGNLVAVPS